MKDMLFRLYIQHHSGEDPTKRAGFVAMFVHEWWQKWQARKAREQAEKERRRQEERAERQRLHQAEMNRLSRSSARHRAVTAELIELTRQVQQMKREWDREKAERGDTGEEVIENNLTLNGCSN